MCISEPVLIAKSSVLLDCKPWDDETDMAEMEKRVRSIEVDGLVWGACKDNQFFQSLKISVVKKIYCEIRFWFNS